MKLLLSFSLILALAALAFSAPTKGRQSAVVPILDVRSGYLLGGSRGGKWISAKNTALALKNGANYRLYSSVRGLGKGRATAPKTEDAPCPDTLWSEISPDSLRKNAEFALGGAHNPLPRALRAENTDQATYKKVVAAILRKNGIAKPIVQITQLWRVDLDGDGTQEVLLTATRKADYGDKNSIAPASRAGDYSLLLLRRVVRGKAQNRVLQGEIYPRAKPFNAPGFYQLAAVLDADGDGKMEFLVRGRYYEGLWSVLYTSRGDAVLTEGCGA